MTRNLKVSVGLVALIFAAGAALVLSSSSEERTRSSRTTPSNGDLRPNPAQVVRADSRRLSTAKTGDATLVEFLDFECEACGAVFPVLEDLREKYADRLTFVIRYFPNEGHVNAQLAAQAVEAAARQNKLEAMYTLMFRRQTQWAEAEDSKETTFVGYARALGLDVAQFKADMNSPEVQARVTRDRDEGLALDVQGTPTLFLNGKMLELTSVDRLEADIRAAIGER